MRENNEKITLKTERIKKYFVYFYVLLKLYKVELRRQKYASLFSFLIKFLFISSHEFSYYYF